MASRLAEAMLEEALSDYARPVLETGKNDGPLVRELFLVPRGLAPGTPYCAAAVWTWEERAARKLGLSSLPVPGTNLARGWIEKFQQFGTWIPKSAFATTPPERGDVLIWIHPEAETNPAFASRGHIALVESVEGNKAHTVEGNPPTATKGVDRMVRDVNARLLLGAGRFPSDSEPSSVSLARSSGGDPAPLLALALAGFLLVKKRTS